ncbi:MAG: hypothetical protein AAF092_10165 [Pseudomonadota bacterium]
MSIEADIKHSLQHPDAGPIFVAGLNRVAGGQSMCLAVHFFKGAASAEQISFITREIHTIDASLRMEVVEHDASAILRVRSLEEFSNIFHQDIVLLDPTGVIHRIGGLVQVAEQLKRSYLKEVADVCWAQEQRQVAVLVRSPEYLSSEQLNSALCDIRDLLLKSGWSGVDCHLAVARKGMDANLVRVDAKSYRATANGPTAPFWKQGLKFKTMARFLAAMSLIGVTATAAAKEPYDPTYQQGPPAACALQDMTNLGLDALGNNNEYRAKCAIKLYLGDLADLLWPIDPALLVHPAPDAPKAIPFEIADESGSWYWLKWLRLPLFQDYGD